MKSIIIIAIIVFNIFSIVLSLKMLKGFDLKRKIALLVINEIVNILLLLVVYAISSKNVLEEVHRQSKLMIISTILPINVMISSTTILNLLNKLSFKEIKDEKFNSSFFISLLIMLFVLIIETSYMHNIQISISNMVH